MSELRKLLNEAGTLLELSEYVEELEKKNENLESRIKELEEDNNKLRRLNNALHNNNSEFIKMLEDQGDYIAKFTRSPSGDIIYDELESRIKELEDENKKLIKHVIKVHKTSIAYGKEGMDIFAHTKLRDEYNEIVARSSQ